MDGQYKVVNGMLQNNKNDETRFTELIQKKQ